MLIKSRLIPQANSLGALVKTVASVGRGASTYQDIAEVIGMDERQGRYYRLASELMGFTRPEGVNRYAVTPLGQALLSADKASRPAVLAEGVLNSVAIQRVLPFLESKGGEGCTRSELEHFVATMTDTTPGMVERRTATIRAWLIGSGLVNRQGDRLILQPIPDRVGFVEYAGDTEPLLPNRFDLTEYQEPTKRVSSAGGTTTAIIDAALRERADQAHQDLTNLVAARLRAAGAAPRSNRYVDLAAVVDERQFLFEVKSNTPANTRDQVRAGVSQLYEYRYLQSVPEAQLVLVIQKPLPRDLGWVADYLITDRDIGLIWDGNQTLYCDSRQQDMVGFLL